MKTIRLSSFILVLFAFTASAQNLTQTIRGRILDQETQTPLIGATVLVMDSTGTLGNIADINGNFRIENVPVGRNSLYISFMGYEEKVIPNVLVSSAKELVLDIPLRESLEELDAVVVTAREDKSEVLNEMALVSARTFSVDETKRFAGSFADPARMVSGFAGVTSNAEGNNDIIVRGNSPRGILWRLEGVEIPNPNHFAWEGGTGGPINALNSNMLNDSDFLTGAFAPEYGNALSGVFDMKLKKGNNENREHTIGISTLGMEVASEGPFKQGYSGSYLFNYRYSSLALIDQMGVVDFGGVPKYQDLSFNINLPIGKKHVISAFGLGGLSGIDNEWIDEEDEEKTIGYGRMRTGLGFSGVSHTYFPTNSTFVKTTLSTSATLLENKDEFLDPDTDDYYIAQDWDNTKSNIKLASTLNHKFNAQHKIETGFIYSHLMYDMKAKGYDAELGELVTQLEDDGNADAIQSFVSWKYRVNEELTMVSGAHYLYFDLNGSHSIEPRLGLNYQLNPRNNLSFGLGIHSRLESISTYLAKSYDEMGNSFAPNAHLKPTKAAHAILGFDHSLTPNSHFKIEAYYQHLYDVPVEDDPTSTHSLINAQDSYVTFPMVNTGTGRNYGLELTVEQFLHKGFYYLFTGSLYESFYTPMDGIERKSRFNGNFATNLLAGKEFEFGRKENVKKVFFVNGKVSYFGGGRFTPIDLDSSIEQGQEVRFEDRPYSERGDHVFILNVAVGVRKNKLRTTQEFKIDLQNATNNQAVVGEYYVDPIQDTFQSTQLGLFPTISYSLSF